MECEPHEASDLTSAHTMGRKRKQRKNPSYYFLIQRGWKMQSTRKKERGKF